MAMLIHNPNRKDEPLFFNRMQPLMVRHSRLGGTKLYHRAALQGMVWHGQV